MPFRWPWTSTAEVSEVAQTAPGQQAAPSRAGFTYGVPLGGTTEYNQGGGGTEDRRSALEELWQAYVACPWSSACVDAIARTITAGGLEVVWDGGNENEADAPDAPPNVVALRSLLDFVNPDEDIRQVTRGIIVDLEVFADAYLEVVWLASQPVALYSLDVPSMRVIADEHGQVTKYIQVTESGKRVEFEPHEVIHFSLDVPRSGLYGLSPTQKALLPITTWLFAAATLKEAMRKGDPETLHVDHPAGMSETDIRKWRQQYHAQNIGPRNIGSPVTTKGGASVTKLKENAILHYISTKTEARDEILSTYGCPPSKVGVIESGNLGGGTGTSQDKTFRVNTCGPIAGIVLEKLIYHLMRVGFGITDWTMRFREIDWRDDQTVDNIESQRLRDGRKTLNAARAEIGEPPVEGGDEPVIIDRQNMVLWRDIAAMSAAVVAGKNAPAVTAAALAARPAPEPSPPADPGPDGGGPAAKESAPARDARRLRATWEAAYRAQLANLLAETNPALARQARAVREAETARTGAFVILRVAADQADALAVDGGEPAADLHVTLACLAQPADEYDDESRESIRAALASAWADTQKPVTAEAFALAQFNPDADEDDDLDPCAALLVQSPELASLHAAVEAVVGEEMSDRFPIWVPHVTLGYGLGVADISGRTGEISFDRLSLVWGDDAQDL